MNNEELLENHKQFINHIVESKYLAEGETCWGDIKKRIVNALPKDTEKLNDITEGIMSGHIIGAGSILSEYNVEGSKNSFSNCYAIQIPEDSIEGIYQANAWMARLFSLRAGCGSDLSILRPNTCLVHNASKTSSGAPSFLNLFNSTTKVISQNGRRAATLMSLDIRHPDAIEFINCKVDNSDLSNMNISLRVPDIFWNAVESDEDWTFIFPDIDADKELYNTTWDGIYENWTGKFKEYETIKARSLLRKIAEAAWACGDPGILYSDNIRNTPTSSLGPINTPVFTNPCSEVPIPNNGNCLLTAIVLFHYVKDGVFDFDLFKKDVIAAVYFLNIVSKANRFRHPLKAQIELDTMERRIGLEITALADCLALMGLKYGSDESIAFIEELMCTKAFYEMYASSLCVKEFGVAPVIEDDTKFNAFINSEYIQRVFTDIKQYTNTLEVEIVADYIKANKFSNVAFGVIGPCGSISLVSDNCSSGLEPVFSTEYTRQVKSAEKKFNIVHGPLLLRSIETGVPYQELAKDYVVAHDLKWQDRLKVQEAAQKYTDGGISSTVNLPNSATVEEIEEIYLSAWLKGIKGITIFRNGSMEGVLSTKKEEKFPIPVHSIYPSGVEMQLLDVEMARRHRIKYKGDKLYVMVALDEDDQALEIFVKPGRICGVTSQGIFDQTFFNETLAAFDGVCRLASKLLRLKHPLEDVIHQLDKASYNFYDIPGIVARVLSCYLSQETIVNEDGEIEEQGMLCPECGEMSVFRDNGCKCCKSCTYSSCA